MMGHTSSDTPFIGQWAATVMLAVACYRRVSIMLHLTPDNMVGYSVSASHTPNASHPVFSCSAVDTIVRQLPAA
jgi:hypothetical protein